MKLGLIAGNGRFPFLVLDAARAQGHEVTVIATKEEAFPELNDAARRHCAAIHWISIGQLGTCISLLKDAGVTQAVMAGQVRVDLLDRDQLLEAHHAALHGQEALGHAAGADALDEVVPAQAFDDARTSPPTCAVRRWRSQGSSPSGQSLRR